MNVIVITKNHDENMVKNLLKQGTDINKEDDDGRTPLFNACEGEYVCRCEDVMEYLVEQGADINKEDNEGRTPLFIACNKSII